MGKGRGNYDCQGLRKVSLGMRGLEYGAALDLSALDWERVKHGWMRRLPGGWDAGEVAVCLGLVDLLVRVVGGRVEASRGGGLDRGVIGSASMSDESRSADVDAVAADVEFFL